MRNDFDCSKYKRIATFQSSPYNLFGKALLSIHQEWADVSVKEHKEIKGLKTQNLRDHMSEAELIFTALAELSTRQIAETVQAKGMPENAEASKKGGGIAKRARLELEAKTGKKVVSGGNFLPPKGAQELVD